MSWRRQAKCEYGCGSSFVHIEVLRGGRGKVRRFTLPRVSRIFSAEIVIKHEKNRVSEHPQIRAPVETLARGLKIYAIHCLTRHAGKCAAADPEGFAHSAAAEGRRERRNGSAAAKAGHGRVGGRMEMSLWLEFRAYLGLRGGWGIVLPSYIGAQ